VIKKKNFFEILSKQARRAAGSRAAFFVAIPVIAVWLVTGALFKYSDAWKLIIYTGTSIITFLMVFLIHKSQNKDSKAIHLKLNKLLPSQTGTRNRMVDIEDLTEEELDRLHKFYVQRSDLAANEEDLARTQSIDAAGQNHKRRLERHQKLTANIPKKSDGML